MGEEELEDWIAHIEQQCRPKWLLVADAVLSGKTGREAYWNAYNPNIDMPPNKADQTDTNAARLIRSDRVQALLSAYRHRNARAENIDLGTVIRAQLDIARRARAAEDFTNERQAMAEVSKLLDLYPSEKREVLLKGEGLADLTPEEWQALGNEARAYLHNTREVIN